MDKIMQACNAVSPSKIDYFQTLKNMRPNNKLTVNEVIDESQLRQWNSINVLPALHTCTMLTVLFNF